MNSDEKPATHEISRRNFLFSTAAASAITLAAPSRATKYAQTPTSFSTLQTLGDRVSPITPHEFHARLLRAQELLRHLNPNLDALFIVFCTSLYKFTGIRWH